MARPPARPPGGRSGTGASRGASRGAGPGGRDSSGGRNERGSRDERPAQGASGRSRFARNDDAPPPRGRQGSRGEAERPQRESFRDAPQRDSFRDGPARGGQQRPPRFADGERRPAFGGNGGAAEPARRPAPGRSGAAEGPVWLYGHHAVRAAWSNPQRRLRRLLLTEALAESPPEWLQDELPSGTPRPAAESVDRREIERHSFGGVHQGIAVLADPLPTVHLEPWLAGLAEDAAVLLLDQVTDPHNVGAILRCASAFGAAGVIVTDRHAPPVTAVLAKAASGALEHMPMIRVANLSRTLAELKKQRFWCVGLDETGDRQLSDIDMSGRMAFVMGAEGQGMRRLTQENCDYVAKLPTQPPIAALNVATAAAVTLYEVARRRAPKGEGSV